MKYIDLTKSNDNTYRSYSEAMALCYASEMWKCIEAIRSRFTAEEFDGMKVATGMICSKLIEATGEQEQAPPIETNCPDLERWFRRISE